MKITVNKVVYDVVKEKEINGCEHCFLDGTCGFYEECYKITGINCSNEEIIFLKVPDSLKNCENCGIKNLPKCRVLNCKNYDKWEAKEW